MRRRYLVEREPLGAVVFRFLVAVFVLALVAGAVFELLDRLFTAL